MFEDDEEAHENTAENEAAEIDEILRQHREDRLDVSQRFQLSQNVAKLLGPAPLQEAPAAQSLWGLEVA
jgi:hypothetical protein